jgi:cytochrome P450
MRLIQANQTNAADGGSASLEDEEVLGNTFAFLFAGHETTASSMAITLALLALHPEEQARAYEAVKKATEDGDLVRVSLSEGMLLS